MEKYPPWQETLQKFQQGPGRLVQVVEGLSGEELDFKVGPESWSIRQNVHHLADGLMIWSMFIRQTLGNPGGEFKLQWYWDIPQDEWAELWGYADREIQSSLDAYKAIQENLSSLLRVVGNPKAYSLRIVWADGKVFPTTIEDAVLTQIDHLGSHLKDIARILNKISE